MNHCKGAICNRPLDFAGILILLLFCLFCVPPVYADLFITNAYSNTVLRVDSSAGGPFEVLVPAAPDGPINPQKIAYGPDGKLYVANFGTYPISNGGVSRYDPDTGAFLGVFVPAGVGGLGFPESISFGPTGNLYVNDPFGSGKILVFRATTGALLGAFGWQGVFPGDMAFGPDGQLYVSSGIEDVTILRVDPETGLIEEIVIPEGSGLGYVSGMEFGPDGNLYMGSGGAGGLDNVVFRYDFDAEVLSTFTVPEPGIGPSFLTHIAFGPDGNLYVSGFADGQVLRYDGTTGDFMDIFAYGNAEVEGFGLSSLTFSPLAPQQVETLTQTIMNLGLPTGITNSLQASLKNIVKILEDGKPANDGAACGKLDAFIDTVEDHVAVGSLAEEAGVNLILQAEAIRQTLGC